MGNNNSSKTGGEHQAPRYDFDQVIDRKGTYSDKWDLYRGREVLPMWVADMDFQSPPEVIQALHQRVDHGIFGYTSPPDELVDVFIERMKSQYNWDIEADWLVWLPGLVCGLNISVRSVTRPGESVITQTPIYPPFLSSISLAGCHRVDAPLKATTDQQWQMDLEGIDITDNTQLFMLCNPQNPTGKVFSREELVAIDEYCQKHNLFVCTDEVHGELLLDPDAEHIPYATISDYAREHSITLLAPSKTFNIAGFGCSVAVIPNKKLRNRFKQVRKSIVPSVNALAYTAALAAYRDSHEWHSQLLEYLRENHRLMLETINSLPGLSQIPAQATYLGWINVSGLGLQNPKSVFEAAGIGLNSGADFGDSDYLRLNFGCPRSTLQQGLERIRLLVDSLQD
ncbi:MalY/PatB family protein [Endozoicomonadaceae bacterium StTr2]